MASSRVGKRTRARTFLDDPFLDGSALDDSARSISMIGIRNARVLPVPVWAVPITSLPSSAGEMARSWMGVRVMNGAPAIFCGKAADGGSSVIVVIRLFFFGRGLVDSKTHLSRVRMP